MNRPFLLRIPGYRDRGPELIQTAEVYVAFATKYRTKRIVSGLFREVEQDGYDRSKLAIGPATPEDGTKPITPRGSTRSGQVRTTIERNSKELAKVLRRITPEASDALADVDRQIGQLEAMIADLRVERAELVEQAWKSGKPLQRWEADPPEGDTRRRVS